VLKKGPNDLLWQEDAGVALNFRRSLLKIELINYFY